MAPKICCLVPVYNVENYLEEALDSLLSQTRKVEEIWCINDQSTDGSYRILQKYAAHIHIVDAPHRGLSCTLNAGIRDSKAELITFLDGDDIWTPDKIERQYAVMMGPAPVDAVFGHMRQFVSPDFAHRSFEFKEVIPGVSKVSMMVWRTAFLQVGYFDEQLERGDFVEWFTRFKLEGLRYQMLDEVIAHRRLRSDSMSSNPDAAKDFALVLKRFLDKKKAKGS